MPPGLKPVSRRPTPPPPEVERPASIDDAPSPLLAAILEYLQHQP